MEWDILELWAVQNARHHNLSFPNNLHLIDHMTSIWDYTLNRIKQKYHLKKKYTKSSIFLVTPWTAIDNIKKHNIFFIITKVQIIAQVVEKTVQMLNSKKWCNALDIFKMCF